MYKGKTVCILVPAYNEETQIGMVLEGIPGYVDKIIVVDDGSKDGTSRVVEERMRSDGRVSLVRHEKNKGVGASVATGYKWARDQGVDVAVRMDGDGQTPPEELESLLDPVATGEVDFAKGNRLFSGEAYRRMPKVRYFGNAALSLLTKIASGYWHVADAQSGYCAMDKKALHLIDWDRLYTQYGQPNDLLVRLNIFDLKVRDVPVKPVYNVGEKSEMRIWKVIFTIGWLLFKLFLWRMREKYVIRNFHPLVFFYALGAFLSVCAAILGVRLIVGWVQAGYAPQMTFLALVFCIVSGLQSLFFGMWFDMENNKNAR